MEAISLRIRAVAVAICAGAATFALVLATTGGGRIDAAGVGRALVAGIVCAALCWLGAGCRLARTAAAIDAAVNRLSQASDGDLEGEIPRQVTSHIPALSRAMAALFSRQRTQLDTVQRLAMIDPVTGLPNRISFRRSVEDRLAAGGPGVAALFFIDLDRFKAVNDTFGHAVGDRLLALVADRLRTAVGALAVAGNEPPLIGRLAGDEFTVYVPDIGAAADAERIGGAILRALGEPFALAEQEMAVGASIGIALRPEHGRTLAELMRSADAAMYHAKDAGRGRAECFTPTLAGTIADRAQLDADLRDALDRGEFALAFQPQVDLSDRRVVAAEALLRWRHPSGETRLPGGFLPRAENSGLIVEIGEWVTANVAETIRRWAASGVEHRLAVNVSQRQIDHADFFRRLREALRAASAPARLLELEITETLAMRCSDETIAAIAALRADGATVAIDDFGTGYSNLVRLRDLPVDRVKLDRSLTLGVVEDARMRTIVQAIVGLMHGLGLEVVAEGVESAAQADVLRVLGCDTMQGYAIAPPMDEAAFLDWRGGGGARLRA